MTGKERPVSVHADIFSPQNEEYQDTELAERWEEIISVRKEVTKVLELARKEKSIGHPLDASVRLGLAPKLADKLAPYEDQLRSIFIVSSVDLREIDQVEGGFESETVPGLKVEVSPSLDPKCERCWIHDPSVGDDKNHPNTCERCRNVLNEIMD